MRRRTRGSVTKATTRSTPRQRRGRGRTGGGRLCLPGLQLPAQDVRIGTVVVADDGSPSKLLCGGTAIPRPGGPAYAWTPGASWPDRATYSS